MDQPNGGRDSRPYIARSHERCRRYGIGTDRVYSSLILEGQALAELLAARQALIDLADPFITHLYEFVRGSGFFAILTDASGCILRMIGDREILARAQDLRMVPGASMDEAHIGTNAMGTALAEGGPVQVSGAEHFVKAYHGWTCSAAPIRDAHGRILGALDLTGHCAEVHSHTLGMVAAAADAIGKILRIEDYAAELTRSKRYTETIIDSLNAGIVTVSVEGTVRTVSQQAARLFGYSAEEMRRSSIQNLLEGWDTILQAIRKDRPFVEEDVPVNARSNKVRFCVTASPIVEGDGSIHDIILVFKELRKVRKLANQLIGRRAIYTFDKIIGANPAFMAAVDFAKKMANSRSTLLLLGESGTGKELFAQSVHNRSERRDENFVAINCGALPRTLIESELFGYEDGAFTGAKRSGQPGKFEIADGGTMFLDEIGEMPLDLQTRLLRVIEEGTVCRIGGSREIPVDVRIIAATNKDLHGEVERGNFRGDLYFRLNVLPLALPALRERPDDIPLLIDFFMRRLSRRLNRKPVALPEAYMRQLMAYSWPGNVRELENLIELIINNEAVVPFPCASSTAPSAASARPATSPRPAPTLQASALAASLENEACLSLAQVEKRHIETTLKRYNGNISLVARALGIGRTTLYRKLAVHDIKCPNMEQCAELEQSDYDQAVPF